MKRFYVECCKRLKKLISSHGCVLTVGLLFEMRG